MIVVSNTSPLNVLVRIGHIDILGSLFGKVFIPPAVSSELSHPGTPEVVRKWMVARPDWLEVRAPSRIDATLEIDDPGEVEAISLALELKADFLLADDRKARRVARDRGIPVTGAVGILELGSVRGLLNLHDAFNRLRTTDFNIAEHILKEALKRDADRRKQR
jgi:predicted nucleic acid-binding protein